MTSQYIYRLCGMGEKSRALAVCVPSRAVIRALTQTDLHNRIFMLITGISVFQSSVFDVVNTGISARVLTVFYRFGS